LPDAIIAADPKFSAAPADSNQILWLALTLTPGLGPTRSRRLVEFFGTVDRVFSASLTELEASGLPVQSAQALATGAGQLNLLTNEEMARAAAADVHLLAFDDPAYPARLRQIYDPPLVLYSGRMFGRTAAGCATCPHPAGRR
jgi:DNA processing protein